MEYRGVITVPGIDVDSGDAERLLDLLQERHKTFGPVVAGDDEALEVILAMDSEVEEDAMREMLEATHGALEALELAARPTAIRMEIVDGL